MALLLLGGIHKGRPRSGGGVSAKNGQTRTRRGEGGLAKTDVLFTKGGFKIETTTVVSILRGVDFDIEMALGQTSRMQLGHPKM